MRLRSALMPPLSVSPSAPQFQLKLSLQPSLLFSPLAWLCLLLYATRSYRLNPSCAMMKLMLWYGLRAFLAYRSALPAMRVANAPFMPGSPLIKRRKSSRYMPFHSAQTSQFGKLPTWYMPMSHGSAMRWTLDSTGCLAISRISGGDAIGWPLSSRHNAVARSNRKPSTWYSSTQCTRESMIICFTMGWLALMVFPQPLQLTSCVGAPRSVM
mmetsp:Transcript_21079/g.63115  ORF Transcript_21079/g.63115 Transcript_21079/m.63115 type:complete len:212 (+) Transcript_21079:768-1403(+)